MLLPRPQWALGGFSESWVTHVKTRLIKRTLRTAAKLIVPFLLFLDRLSGPGLAWRKDVVGKLSADELVKAHHDQDEKPTCGCGPL